MRRGSFNQYQEIFCHHMLRQSLMDAQPEPLLPRIHLVGGVKSLAPNTTTAAKTHVTDFRSVKQATGLGLDKNKGGLIVFGHGHDAPLPPPLQQQQQQHQHQQQQPDKALSKKRPRQQQQHQQQQEREQEQAFDTGNDVDRYAK